MDLRNVPCGDTLSLYGIYETYRTKKGIPTRNAPKLEQDKKKTEFKVAVPKVSTLRKMHDNEVRFLSVMQR